MATTETVYGTLADVRLESLAGRSPELVWTPSAAAVTIDGTIVSAVPITTIPAADSTWTDEFISSELTSPPLSYALKVRMLDPVAGYVWIDFTGITLVVPVGGGNITDLWDMPINGTVVWEVEGDTIPALARPGDIMLNTLTSDLYRLS